jgi:hypothetical protein
VSVEPPGTEPPDESGRSPWQRSWVLPAVMIGLIGIIAFAAIAFGVRDDGGGIEVEETTTETTTTETTTTDGTTTEETTGPGQAAELPSAYAVLRDQDNPMVPGNDRFTELLRLELPPGTYVVSAKVGLHNRDMSVSLRAECELVPSNEDGTRPSGPDFVGGDVTMLHLGPTGLAGEYGEFPLGVTQVLSAPGSVVLGCATYGHQHGAFAQYGWIRAIEVASVKTSRQP